MFKQEILIRISIRVRNQDPRLFRPSYVFDIWIRICYQSGFVWILCSEFLIEASKFQLERY